MNLFTVLCPFAFLGLLLFSGCHEITSEKNVRFKEVTIFERSSKDLPYGDFIPTGPGPHPNIPEFPDETLTGFLNLSNGVVFSHTSGWSGGGPEWLPMKSVAIFLDDDTLATHIITQVLVRDFKKIPYFETITVYTKDHLPEPGTRMPDLSLRLRIQKDTRHGDGKAPHLIFLCGSSIIGGFDPPHQTGDPPLPTWNMEGSIKPLFKGSDWVHNASQSRLVADQIGGKLIEGLLEQIKSLRAHHPILPDLPDSFYPEYQLSKKFHFLIKYNARPLGSFYSLVTPNVSWWSFLSDDSKETVFASISHDLENSGWKVKKTVMGEDPADRSQITLFNEHQNAYLQIGHRYSNQISMLYGSDEPDRFLVIYQQILPFETRETFLDATLNSGLSSQVIAVIPSLMGDPSKSPQLKKALIAAAPYMHPEDFIGTIECLDDYFPNREEVHDTFILASIKAVAFQVSSEFKEKLKRLMERLEYGKENQLSDPFLVPLMLDSRQQKLFGIQNPESLKPGISFSRAITEPFMIMSKKHSLVGLNIYPHRPLTEDSSEAPHSFVLHSFNMNGEFNGARNRFTGWGSGYFSQQIDSNKEHQMTLSDQNHNQFHLKITVGADSYQVTFLKAGKAENE